MEYQHFCDNKWTKFTNLDNEKCPNCGEYFPEDAGIDFEEYNSEYYKNSEYTRILKTMERQKRYVIK